MHTESQLVCPNLCSMIFFLYCSEWVIGNREDLVKDIIAEIKPENNEVIISPIA